MNKSVQIDNNAVFKIIDHLRGELPTNSLVSVQKGGLFGHQLALQNFELLLIEVVLHVAHVLLNLCLFVLKYLLEVQTEPLVENVDLFAVQHRESLGSVDVVVLIFELFPQFLTPLCHDPENFRRLYLQVFAFDFVLRVAMHTLGDLSADLIMGILLDLLLVLFSFLHSLHILQYFFTHHSFNNGSKLGNQRLIFRKIFLSHPDGVVHFFEEFSHRVVKVFEDSYRLLPCLGTVSQRNKFVEDSHDDVVVVAVLSVLQHDIGAVEKVVGDHLDVVDLLHDTAQCLVGVDSLAEWVLQCQIGHDLVLHDIVDGLVELGSDLVLLSIVADISEDLLAAVDLGLLEGHVLFQVVVESGGEDIPADFPDPGFNCIFILVIQ